MRTQSAERQTMVTASLVAALAGLLQKAEVPQEEGQIETGFTKYKGASINSSARIKKAATAARFQTGKPDWVHVCMPEPG